MASVENRVELTIKVDEFILKYVLTYILKYIFVLGGNMDFSYTFPAVKGVQAKKDYYITMIPLRYLAKILPEPGEYLPPEMRSQRRINEQRIPGMKNYIIDNRDTYIFSSLTASIDGEFHFEEQGIENVGNLKISMDAKILINDGQHRRAAISQALLEDDTLGDETISVVFFEDRGLKQSQQMFSDLNMNAQKSSNSINTCFETRDALAVITKEIVANNEFLCKYTDLEKDNLGKNSSKLFTLYNIYRVNKKIVGKDIINDKTESFLQEFWTCVVNSIPEWSELERKEITKKDLREEYVTTLGVTLLSFSRIGLWLFKNEKYSVREYIEKFKLIDWRRSNKIWVNRMIRPNGKIINNENAICLIGNAIKKEIEMPLTREEEKREINFKEN